MSEAKTRLIREALGAAAPSSAQGGWRTTTPRQPGPRRDVWDARWTWFVGSAFVVALVMMRQISALLGRLEAGGSRADMSAVTRPQFGTGHMRAAVETWGNPGGDPDFAASLMRWHLLADTLFIPVYAYVLYRLLRWATRQTIPRWSWIVVVALPAVVDLVENGLTYLLSSVVERSDTAAGSLQYALVFVTWGKWLAVLTALLVIAHFTVPPAPPEVAEEGGVRRSVRLSHRLAESVRRTTPTRRVRIWSRLRIQIVAVAGLAVFVAVPVGGPLDQLPDTLRTFVNGVDPARASYFRAGEIIPALVSLALLCICIWASGRWALLDDPPNNPDGTVKRKWRAPSPVMLLAAAVVVTVVCMGLFFRRPGPLHFNMGVFAIPVVLGAIALASLVSRVGLVHPSNKDSLGPPERPGEYRPQVRRAVHVLTALPVAIAGLALARAFADPLLVGALTRSGPSALYFAVGVAAAVLAVPLAAWVVAWFERHVLRDRRNDAVDLRRWPVAVVSAVLLVVVIGSMVSISAQPFTVASWWNVTGILTVFLSALCLLGGGAQWLAERSEGLAVTQRCRLGSRTPLIALGVVVFVVAGVMDTDGGFHDVRLQGSQVVAPSMSLSDQFTAWFAVNKGCTVSLPGSMTGQGVPLVLVAAPGGGIRAAYWTASALDEMDTFGNPVCGPRRVFAASGVSGGSVGLTVHYVHPGQAGGREVLDRLSDETPLAADAAGMFFRDLPAAVIGLTSGWGDRAALLERAWERADPALSTAFLTGMAPGVVDDTNWRPLLLLNGTEVHTGCRVVVSTSHVAAATGGAAPGSCRAPSISTNSDQAVVPGSLDFQDFRDLHGCEGRREADVNASTAALLSARFPFVSPSGELFHCNGSGSKNQERIASLDGGAAENTGIESMLDLWQQLEPLVRQHNENGAETPVVPLLAILDNHYESTVRPGAAAHTRELFAPLKVAGARATLANAGVLTQTAALRFRGALPGMGPETAENRLFRIGPRARPSVAAPLGWALSDLTRRELQQQLADSLMPPCVPDISVIGPEPGPCLSDRLVQLPG